MSGTGLSSEIRMFRSNIKLSIYQERSVFVPKSGMRPVCAVCGDPIVEEADMHEAIVTRAQAPGLHHTLLFARQNCVLVHPGGKGYGSCHGVAHTSGGYTSAVLHLAKYEGVVAVAGWMLEAHNATKSGLLDYARKLYRVLDVQGGEWGSVGLDLEFMLAGWEVEALR